MTTWRKAQRSKSGCVHLKGCALKVTQNLLARHDSPHDSSISPRSRGPDTASVGARGHLREEELASWSHVQDKLRSRCDDLINRPRDRRVIIFHNQHPGTQCNFSKSYPSKSRIPWIAASTDPVDGGEFCLESLVDSCRLESIIIIQLCRCWLMGHLVFVTLSPLLLF